jgi:hypothetical protein
LKSLRADNRSVRHRRCEVRDERKHLPMLKPFVRLPLLSADRGRFAFMLDSGSFLP